MRYSVPLYGQRTPMSCWAVSMAMILSWAQRQSVSPESIRDATGYTVQYTTQGLDPNDRFPLSSFGFVCEEPACYTVSGFNDLIQYYGPLWIATGPDLNGDGRMDPHIVVATGFDANPDPRSARVHINDPWARSMRSFRLPNAGSRYTMGYDAFATGRMEALGAAELAEPAPVYVAHLRSRPHSD